MNTYEASPIAEPMMLSLRRTKLLSYPAYAKQLAGTIESFEVVTAALGDQDRIRALSPDRPMVSSEIRCWDAISYVQLQYSAGEKLSRLRVFLPAAVSYWAEYAGYHSAFHLSPLANGRRVPHLDLHDKDYWKAIRLTSFAILLGHTDLLPRIAALWDYENDEMDGLLERLVAPFVAGRAAPPDTCTRHLPYFKLLKVFAAEPGARPALMARYMDQWYTASRREPYYDSHTRGRDHSFLGYWSFEAAAVAFVLDIDDSTFRDHEFYPRDLADFARSLPRPAALGGAPAVEPVHGARLRCAAGQPCPREGYWFSPAAPASRRHFTAGQTLPDLGGDFGATVWQWDAQQ